MCTISQVILLLCVSLLPHVSDSLSDPLDVIVTNTRLPSPRAHITTGYDGDDTIYLWGGHFENDFVYDILRYSISKQTIENIGKMPDHAFGSGCWIGNSNFVHLGGISFAGSPYYSDVWNFDTSDPSNWISVTNIPRGMAYSSSVWDEGDNTYIIGGNDGTAHFNTILKYSRKTQTVVNVGTLPTGRFITAAVWVNTTGSAYIFGGGSDTGFLKDILKYNTLDGRVTTLSVTLPEGIGYASAVWTGKETYIIGGYTATSAIPPPILRFNPTTTEVTSVPVNNFPAKLYRTGCVFVEKLNRIYIFGGHAEERYRDDIMYIDLNDSSAPSTTTEDSTTEGTPTTEVAKQPTTEPTTGPTTEPTAVPTTELTTELTTEPTTEPTTSATTETWTEPTTSATTETRTEPTTEPTTSATTETRTEPTTSATTETTTEPTTEPTTTKSPTDFECPTETGLYADPKNCRGFYNCDAWFPYHFCCPLPLFYNPLNERCDFQDMVECHNDPGLPCDSPPGKLIGYL